MGPDVHPDVLPLAFLLGTWRGTGKGEFPTIEPFEYGEEIVFEHVGDPFLVYAQRSWLLADGSVLHLERGFLRPGGEGRVELTLAHPLGLTEVSEGPLRGSSIDLRSTSVGRSRTGSEVTGLVRRYRVEAGAMRYELDMAMERVPMTRHLSSTLSRASS